MKKKLTVLLLAVVMAFSLSTSVFAADAYEPANEHWSTAPLLQWTPPSTGQAIYGDFHHNSDGDHYLVQPNPNYLKQYVQFLPPDNQDYIFAAYKRSDFQSPSGSVKPVAFHNTTGGEVATISWYPEPGEQYIVFVSGMNWGTFPTGQYQLVAYMWNF